MLEAILEIFLRCFNNFRGLAKTGKIARRRGESIKMEGWGGQEWHQNQKKTHRKLLQKTKREIIPKWSQNGRKMEPKWSQNEAKIGPKWSPKAAKWSQNGHPRRPRHASGRSRRSQNRSIRAPRRLRHAQDAPVTSEDDPDTAQDSNSVPKLIQNT